MNAITISDKAKTVLAAIIRGAHTRDEIAKKLGVSVPVVNGSITSLKRNGLVEVNDESGEILASPEAPAHAGVQARAPRAPRENTKMEQARTVFNKLYDKGRQVVLAQFRETIGLTAAGASTYYQTLRRETGAASAYQRSKTAPAAKRSPASKKAPTMTKRGSRKAV